MYCLDILSLSEIILNDQFYNAPKNSVSLFDVSSTERLGLIMRPGLIFAIFFEHDLLTDFRASINTTEQRFVNMNKRKYS